MNRLYMFIILTLLTSSIYSQENMKNTVPVTIQDTIKYLDTVFTENEKEDIRKLSSPDDFTIWYIFKTGPYRNNLLECVSVKNKELYDNIIPLDFNIHFEDFTMLILENYWYYLHGIVNIWDLLLSAYDLFERSGEGVIISFPEGIELEKEREYLKRVFYFQDVKFTEWVYIYVETQTDSHYFYSFYDGWIVLDSAEFLIYSEMPKTEKEVFIEQKYLEKRKSK